MLSPRTTFHVQDLWALMDFAQPGLLGNHATRLGREQPPNGGVRRRSEGVVWIGGVLLSVTVGKQVSLF